MYRRLRCRNTDCGPESLASDVLLLLCHERFESKLTTELPFILLRCWFWKCVRARPKEICKIENLKNVPAYLKRNLCLHINFYRGLKGSFNSKQQNLAVLSPMSIHSNKFPNGIIEVTELVQNISVHFGTCSSISVHTSVFLGFWEFAAGYSHSC